MVTLSTVPGTKEQHEDWNTCESTTVTGTGDTEESG